ncbi:hypothetical protein G6F56_012038 [Rhizopus delemar]|nr:hypothetical protein G6F56_012038 [Rhizopus delemar]
MMDSTFSLDMNENWFINPRLVEPVPFEGKQVQLYMLSKQPVEYMTEPTIVNPIFLQKDATMMLDENEQRSFSNFLDSFLTEDPPIKKRTKCKSLKKRRPKELLTEDEKRANHITSEQKRRGMIRNGFKELTELVPSLVNTNHSKSTVLFKSAELIRELEEKNKNLKEKVERLKLRLKEKSELEELPSSTKNALLAHKVQQRQLLLLQNQIQKHQGTLGPYILQKEENNKAAIRIL